MSTDNIIVYGASDDLVETEGLFREEFNTYGDLSLLTVKVEDATFASLTIEFDQDGEWRIKPVERPDLITIIEARHTDNGDFDEDGCPGYSDKAFINMVGIERRRINVTCVEVTE